MGGTAGSQARREGGRELAGRETSFHRSPLEDVRKSCDRQRTSTPTASRRTSSSATAGPATRRICTSFSSLYLLFRIGLSVRVPAAERRSCPQPDWPVLSRSPSLRPAGWSTQGGGRPAVRGGFFCDRSRASDKRKPAALEGNGLGGTQVSAFDVPGSFGYLSMMPPPPSVSSMWISWPSRVVPALTFVVTFMAHSLPGSGLAVLGLHRARRDLRRDLHGVAPTPRRLRRRIRPSASPP